jgi:hypothetical protein
LYECPNIFGVFHAFAFNAAADINTYCSGNGECFSDVGGSQSACEQNGKSIRAVTHCIPITDAPAAPRHAGSPRIEQHMGCGVDEPGNLARGVDTVTQVYDLYDVTLGACNVIERLGSRKLHEVKTYLVDDLIDVIGVRIYENTHQPTIRVVYR